MVDTVSTDVLMDGNNIHIVRLTGVSDSTGETNVVKVDLSTLTGPDNGVATGSLRVDLIEYDVQGYSHINLEWDGTTDTNLARLSGQGMKVYQTPYGGLQDDSTGGTGDILLTSVGAAANASYDITLHLRKKQ